MNFKYQVLTVLVFLLPCYTYGRKFNISFSNLATCEEYNIKSRGYTYADFFQLNSMKNAATKNNERLHLKFYVMTSMDAHILLSEVDNPRKSDRVYEIVLGAGANSFSTIRIMMSRERVATTMTPDLLSVFDPMPVEIIQTNDGVLLVNIPNFAEPHLNYTDQSPLNIKYVSFSSYGSVSAKWFYDCQFDGFFGEMEMETRPLSNEERLVAEVLNMSDPKVPPPNTTEVAFSFKVRSVEFNQRASILSTRLHIVMNWTDSRISWDPSAYGNVTHIVQPLFNIWHPELNIEDGALSTFKNFHPFFSIRVDSNGKITMLARNAELHSWCFDVTPDWPNDVTNCDIVIETINSNIKLAYDITAPITDQTINELSEWSIDKVSVLYVTLEKVPNGNESTEELLLQSIEDDLKIRMTISRNSAFYHSVFTTPALVIEFLILLAFFLEKYRRGGLILVALMVSSLALMFVGKHAPAIIIPDIVTVYEFLMVIATLTYILHVLSIWFESYPPKSHPNELVLRVINCTALRFILAMNFQDSADYLNAQEFPWKEISKVLNRSSFILILIIFVSIDFTI